VQQQRIPELEHHHLVTEAAALDLDVAALDPVGVPQLLRRLVDVVGDDPAQPRPQLGASSLRIGHPHGRSILSPTEEYEHEKRLNTVR
jgi:hypothetical protein